MTLIQEARRVYRRTRRNPDCSFLELVARLRYEQSRKYRQKVVRIKHAIHHSMPTIRRRLDAWAAGDFTGALL